MQTVFNSLTTSLGFNAGKTIPMAQTRFDRHTPHGHTADYAEPVNRLLVEVTVRDNVSPILLNNGRAYGPGTHQIQIYETDLKALEDRLETEPELVKAAEQRYKMLLGRFIKENPLKNNASTYPSSVSKVFHESNFRGIKPLVSVKTLNSLGTIEEEAATKAAKLVQDLQPKDSSGDMAAILAGMMKTIDALNKKLDAATIKEKPVK